MAEELDTLIPHEAVQHFSLGTIKESKLLKTKGNRKAYKVTTDIGVFVIKALGPETTNEKVQRDIYVLNYLPKFNFPAPRLLNTSDGQKVIYIDDRPVFTYRYIDGTTPSADTAYFLTLGEVLATLHSLPHVNYPYIATFTPDKELPIIRENLSHITSDQDKVRMLLSEIQQFTSFAVLPQTIIHTDPYFTNIIEADGVVYLLDLDDAGIAPAVIDVGYVLAHSCTTEPADREELGITGMGEGILWHQDWAESFMQGYTSIRKLAPIEKQHLTDAARFAMLAYIIDEANGSISNNKLQRYQLIKHHVPQLQV